ncbi:MAG: tetratricopeptide repeat protein [Clostridiales bacterium]|nr:tetratricopeptide repeat protein [Clostridiales bacterium]
MAGELFASKERKVIPFDQNGQFYHKKAKKHMDNNNYLDALNFYRKAVEKEPKNVEYLLGLAEVFTEMGCFDQSSKVLFTVLQKERARSDCYFGLGCNFLGMQDYKRAFECFKKYIEIDPAGLYSDEANDLMDILEDYDHYERYGELNILDLTRDNAYGLATEGKDLLDRGDYEKAISKLEKAVKIEPNMDFVKNNLSLALFCAGKLDEAIDISLEVIEKDPRNIHANCNLCLFLNERDGVKAGQEYLDRIVNLKTQDPEEIHKIAVTLCELKEHSMANLILKQLLHYRPYDIRVLHYVAASFFNMGKFKEAFRYWDKIRKIDPDNTISGYYMRWAQDCINGKREGEEITYHFQVSYAEVLRRVKELNGILKLDGRDLLIKWKNDDTLRVRLSWGLELNDDLIKKAILNVVASFNDIKAEDFLREFLLRPGEDEELKTEAMGLLKQMSADEPYITCVGDEFVEVRVDLLEDSLYGIPRKMETVLNITFRSMEGRYEQGYEEDIKDIWLKFVASLTQDNMPRIKKYEAWAAALELCYCIDRDIRIRKKDIADYYNISYSALLNNLKKIKKVLDTN